MSRAAPRRGTVVTRTLATCSTCGELIFRGHQLDGEPVWMHNRTGSEDCGARVPDMPVQVIP